MSDPPKSRASPSMRIAMALVSVMVGLLGFAVFGRLMLLVPQIAIYFLEDAPPAVQDSVFVMIALFVVTGLGCLGAAWMAIGLAVATYRRFT